MIDLLSIQETSRTGSPPTPDVRRGEEGLSGKPFNEYLEQADAADTKVPAAGDSRETPVNEVVSSGNERKGSLPGSGESEAASEKVSNETGKDKKDKTGESSGPSGAEKKVQLKDRTEDFQGKTKKSVMSAFAEVASVKKGSAGNSSKKADLKVPAKGKEEGPRLEDESTEGLEFEGPEKSASSVREDGQLLNDIQNRGLVQRPADPSVPIESGKSIPGLNGESVNPAGKKEKLKIELSDQRKSVKDGAVVSEKELGKNNRESRVEAFKLKSDAVVNPGKNTLGNESVAVSSGIDSRDGFSDEKEVPFRVVELGTPAEREGNVETLSASKGQIAGHFKTLLKDKGVPEIVKQTGILLKDNNQGEIKLILRPESLGKVRIRLNLNENNIAGRIFVENINVKDAFNSSLDDLQRALRDAGFDNTALEVFVQGEGAGEGRRQAGDDRPVMVHPSVIETIEENIPLADSQTGNDDVRVNLLA